MPLHLSIKLTLLYIMTVSALLPSPQNVEMVAVDMKYVLHWDWNYTQLENPVTFTVEYIYDDQVNEEPYELACEGSREYWCNFTQHRLAFSGSYLIRVRAEAGQQHSNWTQPRLFRPQEHMQLTPPRVDVKADVDVLMLTISKSDISDMLNLQCNVQYWEKLKPEQKHMKKFESLHAPLTSLKPGTEYCVQVNVFSQKCDHSSNYTSPQCVYTTGRPLVWLRILPVLCGILLFLFLSLLYKWHKFRRKPTEYTTPESIMGFPSAPLLLEVQEECCTVACVNTPAIQLTHTVKEEQEQEHTPELQTPESTCHWRDGSAQDSRQEGCFIITNSSDSSLKIC